MPHRDHPKQNPATREEVARELANPDGREVAKHWFGKNKDIYEFERSLMDLLNSSKLMQNNKGIGEQDKDLILITFIDDLKIVKPLKIVNLSD